MAYGAEEDWIVAKELLSHKRIRHSLFFIHLAIEKTLKALICKEIRVFAPRIHNLVRLAETARVRLNSTQIDVLADLNEFNLEGRYPDQLISTPTFDEAGILIKHAEEIMKWLTRQL